MTNHFKEKKAEFDRGEKFIKSGGEILESHPDGRPARWKSGKGKNGAPIHPKGIAKETIPYINEKGGFEGRDPDKEFLEQIQNWRSDWITPEEGREKNEEQ